MALQTVTVLSRTGIADLVASAVAADVGLSDSWPNTGKEMVFVNNGGGSPITVTLTLGDGGKVDGQVPAAKTVTVNAGKSALIGPFPPSIYNVVSTGNASIAYSGVTSVKVLVVQFVPPV